MGLFNFTKQREITRDKDIRPCILDIDTISTDELIELYKPAVCFSETAVKKGIESSADFTKDELLAKLAYVWCDGFESKKWQERNCKYLGIRLTDDFILHESIMENARGEYIGKFMRKCLARKLSRSEFLLLLKVWNIVSEMRVTAHDEPLPQDNVWLFRFNDMGNRCLCDFQSGEWLDCKRNDCGTLLLAVC